MRADLIGFMGYGPKQLTFDEAVVLEFAQKRQALLKRWLELLNSRTENQHGLPGVEEALERRIEFDALNRELGYPTEFDVEELADIDADRLTTEVVDVWRTGARDTACRDLPDGTRVLFTGATSYGETPDGYGYTTMTRAEKLGILDLMGIK